MSKRRIRQRKTKTTRNNKAYEYTIYSITIPEEIAKNIPEDMRFVAELTEDGLLFRPVVKQHKHPSWLPKPE